MDKTITARRCLTISEKQAILKNIDNALKTQQRSSSDLSNLLNLPRSTISTIINNRHAIESTPITELSRARARAKFRKPKIRRYEELETRLQKWLKNRKKINGTLLREKAKMLAEEMEIDGFTASNGWFDRFRKRCFNPNIKCDHFTGNIDSSDFLDHLEKIPDFEAKQTQNQFLMKKLKEWENLVRSEGIKVTRILLRDMSIALAAALTSNTWLAKYQKQPTIKICEKCCLKKQK